MSALVAALGLHAVRDLSALVGGRHIRVPSMGGYARSVKARLRLIELVGPHHAANLITAFGNTRIYVPAAASRPVASRTNPISVAEVVKLTRKGWSATRIAGHLNCTARTVYAKRAIARRDNRALSPIRKRKPA